MLALPAILTPAWWAAKALGIKAAVSRLLNPQMAAAIAISIAVVALVFGGIVSGRWIVGKIENGAVAIWQSKLVTSRLVSSLRDRKAQREADQRVAAERVPYVETLRGATAHAVDLEKQLAQLLANPVCYPPSITEELRK